MKKVIIFIVITVILIGTIAQGNGVQADEVKQGSTTPNYVKYIEGNKITLDSFIYKEVKGDDNNYSIEILGYTGDKADIVIP